MSWLRKCSACGARGRSLSFYGPLTPQAARLGHTRANGESVYVMNAARLCPSCIINLT